MKCFTWSDLAGLAPLLRPIARFIVRHVHELWVRMDFYLIETWSGRPALFIENRIVRKGVVYATDGHPLVAYLAYNSDTCRTERTCSFLFPADKHTRWTYGWCETSRKALLAADALR